MLDGYAERFEAFSQLDTRIIAASHDAPEHAAEVAANLPFPVAHEVNRAQADTIGAWWDERLDCIQPSEFLLNHSGRVLHSTYSSSPVGRTDPQEALVLLGYLSARK